ncbi:MAG: murein hydrolase activator EnvC family protein [Gemmiger sp.]
MKTMQKTRNVLSLLLAVVMALALFFSIATSVRADDKKAALEANKAAAQSQLDQINAQIKQNEENKNNAQELKEQYEQASTLIKSQILTLNEQIAYLSELIYNKQTEIEQKQAEIDQKQAEYDERWAGFKERMRAMQMLNDGGAIALLSSATDLYQLLTFADTLEQISTKDQQICDELENERIALETAKAELEAAKAELEANQADLESQHSQLEGKVNELAANIQKQDETISAAKAQEKALDAAAAEARALLDKAAAELDAYLNEQIRKYGSAALTCSLNFGPALATYTYISCVFGDNGHRGTDFAAPGGTPIYAVADGIVTDATYHWSWGNYVQIYHGKDDKGNTYATLYAHMNATPVVRAGQTVTKGTVLGYVGTTGTSTGNHLHLEMKINGVLTNAANWIPH